jgi:hypothetical protein
MLTAPHQAESTARHRFRKLRSISKRRHAARAGAVQNALAGNLVRVPSGALVPINSI